MASYLRDSEELEHELRTGGDGRRSSAESERGVIECLRVPGRWNITAANVGSNQRVPYDFSLLHGNITLYIDLKISRLKAADNTDCKAGIYHALTGRDPGEAPSAYEEYFQALRGHLSPTGASDFYFLVIGKNRPVGDPERAFVCSLRTMRKVVPSGSNLPFQCRWAECREPQERAYEQAKEFLLGNFHASLVKRAAALYSFRDHFPEIGPAE